MRKITFAQATLEAMAETMAKDDKIFVMGEDLARQGGIFGQFKGLPQQFPGRVLDTPISETFIIGGGVGAALAGARPVVDMHFADFIGVPMDEVFNQMAKARYMFGGQAKVPLVLRAPDGMTIQGAAQHSQCVEAWFTHIPGVQVVAPSNPYDAKMVLKAAIESDDPVIYFENKILYKEKGEVPELADEVPYTIGKARVEREGSDVTIVSYSIGMKNARGAADLLAKEGIKAEVIDLITLSPWDKETVLNSVKKTHRLCIVHEAVKQGGFGAEIAATVAEEALEYLDAPILRYGAPFCPIPFAPTLEKMVRIFPEDLVKGIKGMF
ncbi:alpha-ketoacid dehydrogenase subunit beta [Dysosmobacter sp.]|jgi:pyruvate/2-oxoglutarate/acetoin dehydrogenase E1 component|uniref:alpha-ketoacid dehydrogenase subunit beta n=1 Tax=Dysosmobacter sp. TaxID=2591382 RepID=UPI002A983CEE|nr:alpha-ketoacid dehydrogenase subunit beta [Dysosmobacter sp.]MCI6055479.1 alpha-ketoacid dehydrogenase subunit beta [Dysosmobacter sp.]MDY5510569.1 alpha-ketoacid dehydrogenase subunit beta [Dysosmobacter sp.]